MHVTYVIVVTCCFCLERVPHQGLVASPASGTSHARGNLSTLQWDSTIALWPCCGHGAVFCHVDVRDLGQRETMDLAALAAKDTMVWV